MPSIADATAVARASGRPSGSGVSRPPEGTAKTIVSPDAPNVACAAFPKSAAQGALTPGLSYMKAVYTNPATVLLGSAVARYQNPSSWLPSRVNTPPRVPGERGLNLAQSPLATTVRPSISRMVAISPARERRRRLPVRAQRQTLEGNCGKSRRADAQPLPRARARAMCKRCPRAARLRRGARRGPSLRRRNARAPVAAPAHGLRRYSPSAALAPSRARKRWTARGPRRASDASVDDAPLALQLLPRRSCSGCSTSRRTRAAARRAGARARAGAGAGGALRRRRGTAAPRGMRPSTPTGSGGSACAARYSRCPCRARSSATPRSSRR